MYRLVWIIAVLLILTLVGIGWFTLVEGWSLLDAAYMTVITISTVGYNEVRPLSDRSRVFVMFYLIGGLGVFLFAIVQLGELIVRAELRTWLRRRGMISTLHSVKNHFVVCGFGRMGRTICRHLADRSLPFVVVDRDESALADCEQQGWPCVCGDATSDHTLLEAGIERARGFAVVLDSDADNLYVVLSARLLSPGLQIIAKATDENGARKMEKAGANRVVSLFATGAATMAQLMINPQVEDFFEIVSGSGTTLDLAEIRVSAGSPCAHLALEETDFRKQGVIIVAIRRPDGEILLPPSASTPILPDDVLIALGEVSAVSGLLSREAQ
ncbi:potassium channel family protein [Novipirellula artificiosorum]|uniref:Voltage-gated potassium channel Kch n=1 Tax=Novipirellula artificiosorum TaxID=2528016 RepID=A0A5C6E3U8_9BACT|nr:potassium channel protein [Novipirellula artificiosorum]TWU42657.1 Voltage-gated potassium channel Kch [Novipirellula artificiosorum]